MVNHTAHGPSKFLSKLTQEQLECAAWLMYVQTQCVSYVMKPTYKKDQNTEINYLQVCFPQNRHESTVSLFPIWVRLGII